MCFIRSQILDTAIEGVKHLMQRTAQRSLVSTFCEMVDSYWDWIDLGSQKKFEQLSVTSAYLLTDGEFRSRENSLGYYRRRCFVSPCKSFVLMERN